MAGAIKARGEVSFEEAGGGIVLCLFNSDLARLQQDLGPRWFGETCFTLAFGAPPVDTVEMIIKAAAKLDRKPVELDEAQLNSVSFERLAELAFEAITLSMRGITAKQMRDEMEAGIRKQMEEGAAQAEDPLPTSPETSSSESVETASGPASASKSSGRSRRPKRSSTSRKGPRPK